MNITQKNGDRFSAAKAANPSGVIYIAWESMNEIRFVTSDKAAFIRWIETAPRYPYITITEMVLGCPDTACYYQIEDWHGAILQTRDPQATRNCPECRKPLIYNIEHRYPLWYCVRHGSP